MVDIFSTKTTALFPGMTLGTQIFLQLAGSNSEPAPQRKPFPNRIETKLQQVKGSIDPGMASPMQNFPPCLSWRLNHADQILFLHGTILVRRCVLGEVSP